MSPRPYFEILQEFPSSGNVHSKEHSYVREPISAKINMPWWLTFRDSVSVFISLFATQDVIFNSKAAELPNALKSLGNLLSNQDKIPHLANQFNTDVIRSNFTHLLPSLNLTGLKDQHCQVRIIVPKHLWNPTRKEILLHWINSIATMNLFTKASRHLELIWPLSSCQFFHGLVCPGSTLTPPHSSISQKNGIMTNNLTRYLLSRLVIGVNCRNRYEIVHCKQNGVLQCITSFPWKQ